MNPLRLVLVTRRFWPLVGDVETVLGDLAWQLRELGAHVTVLTARWDKSWPDEFVYRDVPVVRLPHPGRSAWGTLRHLGAVRQWLRRHAREIDAVLVSRLRYEAYAVLGAMRRLPHPVVLRAEEGGYQGDCQWQQRSRFGRRVRQQCLSADAFVVTCPTIGDELIAAEFSHDRIHKIPNGVALRSVFNPARRAAARASLAEAHPIFQLDERAPLVVYCGRLSSQLGLDELVNCWPQILRRWPTAKLWLLGEGPHAQSIWHRVKELGLAERVIMPGSFDFRDEVLPAADLFVLPGGDGALSPAALEAMSAGVPVIAADTAANRAIMTHGQTGWLVAPTDQKSLSAAVSRLLEDPRAAAAIAAAARRRVEQQFSLERMAKAHLALFERLLAARRDNRP